MWRREQQALHEKHWQEDKQIRMKELENEWRRQELQNTQLFAVKHKEVKVTTVYIARRTQDFLLISVVTFEIVRDIKYI